MMNKAVFTADELNLTELAFANCIARAAANELRDADARDQ